jgi:hypothetical protein
MSVTLCLSKMSFLKKLKFRNSLRSEEFYSF